MHIRLSTQEAQFIDGLAQRGEVPKTHVVYDLLRHMRAHFNKTDNGWNCYYEKKDESGQSVREVISFFPYIK